MTRKDYIVIADELKFIKKDIEKLPKQELFDAIVGRIGAMLWRDNSRFSFDKFMNYIKK